MTLFTSIYSAIGLSFILGSITGCEGQINSDLDLLNAGDYKILEEINLPTELDENSGIVLLDTLLLSFNDSGNDPVLYALSASSGSIIYSWEIKNAKNNDWEDICMDEKSIYIGDFGNNLGTRKDLSVLSLNRDSLFSFTQESVEAEYIHFSFEDQESFLPSFYNHSFDCEAIISMNDSLVLFSKDWKNQITTTYILPKKPGTYIAKKSETFQADCFISGADYKEEKNILVLTGYSSGQSFVFKFKPESLTNIFAGNHKKTNLVTLAGIQNEGISLINENEIYLTCERQHTPARLYKIRIK